MAGAGIGIASGDPSKAFQYAAAGGAAGYYGANYYGDKLADVGDAGKSARMAFWGNDMKARDQYLFDKEFKSNPENIDALTKVLGSRSAALEAMRNGDVQALLNNNVTDIGKIGKTLSLRDKYLDARSDYYRPEFNGDSDKALEMAIATAKWNRDASSRIYDTNSRDRIAFENRLASKLKAQGLSDSQASARIKQILDDMEYFET